VRELRGLGLSPDLVVCRSEHPITEAVKAKVSNFCHVPPEQVSVSVKFNFLNISLLYKLKITIVF
jgi:CTP synthase (UTP-ammonia lyase)